MSTVERGFESIVVLVTVVLLSLASAFFLFWGWSTILNEVHQGASPWHHKEAVLPHLALGVLGLILLLQAILTRFRATSTAPAKVDSSRYQMPTGKRIGFNDLPTKPEAQKTAYQKAQEQSGPMVSINPDPSPHEIHYIN